jgi:putative Holliday junction resolvase
VAVADDARGSVRPLATFRRRSPEEDAARVARLAAEQRADQIVVGLPFDMDGGEGEQARRTRDWGDAVATRTGLPIVWRDERLTSEAAEATQPRLRRDRATGRPTRAAILARRVRVDRDAAARILQAELDARARSRMATPQSAAATPGQGDAVAPERPRSAVRA